MGFGYYPSIYPIIWHVKDVFILLLVYCVTTASFWVSLSSFLMQNNDRILLVLCAWELLYVEVL
jgi:hypothetical protein